MTATEICTITGHINSTGFDVERCVYCGEPVNAEAAAVLAAAACLRRCDVIGAIRILDGLDGVALTATTCTGACGGEPGCTACEPADRVLLYIVLLALLPLLVLVPLCLGVTR